MNYIFCEVSAIAKTDLKSGIERVVRAIMSEFAGGVTDLVVVPTVIENGVPVYASAYADHLGIDRDRDLSGAIPMQDGDHFLMIDWAPDTTIALEDWLLRFRANGGIVTAVIYDLLPLEHPHYFPDWLRHTCSDWLQFLIRTVDHLACISQAVAESVAHLSRRLIIQRRDPFTVGFFHLGYDLARSHPSRGLPSDSAAILDAVGSRPTFLILGTVEPRKGHAQCLAAFDRLWTEDLDVGLLIVGREGWMVEDVAAAIKADPRYGDRLLWLASASDEFLSRLLRQCAALLAPSFGEGFGLPLIEAASLGVPIVARDLPVFREVAAESAYYFRGAEPSQLADAIVDWLALRSAGRAPDPQGMKSCSWASSATQLLDIMKGERRFLTNRVAPAAQPKTSRQTVPELVADASAAWSPILRATSRPAEPGARLADGPRS